MLQTKHDRSLSPYDALMLSLGNNMTTVAEEYGSIPASLENALDSIDGFIDQLQSSFEDGELVEADAVVTQYHRLRTDLETFNHEMDNLLSYLRADAEPETVEDIDQIETASRDLMESTATFRDRCQDLSVKLSELGLSEPAESLIDVVAAFGEFPAEIEDSLLENQLLLFLKAEHFPSAVKDTIPELILELDANDRGRRQNSAAILARLAADFPAAVGEYHGRLTTRLLEAPVEEQKNLLAALLFLSVAESMPDTVGREEALELIRADDITVALYAALVLGTQSTTAEQARLIATRVVSLLDGEAATNTKVNATMVLYQLAESHPDSVSEFVPDVAPMLDDPAAQVQENVVELLGVIGRAEYRTEIVAIREETDDKSLEKAATTALEELPEDSRRETEIEDTTTQNTNSSTSPISDSDLLNQIEWEFETDQGSSEQPQSDEENLSE